MAAASSSSKASSSKRKTPTATGSASGKSKKAKSASSSTGDEASIPLGRALASTEKRVRDGAVRSLTAYLAENGAHTIGDLELQKLWKGLFYCFWMSDKPLIQQRLANDLAQLVLVHPASSSSTAAEGESTERALAGLKFLEAFWDTLVAECVPECFEKGGSGYAFEARSYIHDNAGADTSWRACHPPFGRKQDEQAKRYDTLIASPRSAE